MRIPPRLVKFIIDIKIAPPPTMLSRKNNPVMLFPAALAEDGHARWEEVLLGGGTRFSSRSPTQKGDMRLEEFFS
jgi:hypothetical protein